MNPQKGPRPLPTADVSPKQPPQLERRDWYPYYAGFTEAFVKSVIDSQLPDAESIVDPWNGTGTTTAVCEQRGLISVGIDINPALTVIAKARLLPFDKRGELEHSSREVLARARRIATCSITDDPLETWVRPDAVRRIRAIQQAIHISLAPTASLTSLHPVIRTVDQLSAMTCFFYCALFGTVRDSLEPYRTTNPMWIKKPRTHLHRVRPSWAVLCKTFIAHVNLLSDRLVSRGPIADNQQAAIITADAGQLPFKCDHFDGAITSPPYATRIDYVRGMLPELALLGADNSFVMHLRRVLTGTPVVKGVCARRAENLDSKSARAALETVSAHRSKGSRRYYLPWLRNYFQQLQSGLVELSRGVAPSGAVCIVVQDSYYKEHRIDLQAIVIELMAAAGRNLEHRADYPVSARRPKTATREGARLTRKTMETLLVFR